MPDPYKQVQSGEGVRFSATAWNSMLGAGKAWRNSQAQAGAPVLGESRSSTIIRVKNELGDAPRAIILGLNGPLFSPADSTVDTFLREVTFRGVSPDPVAHRRRYAVTLQASQHLTIIPCCLAGLCQVKVDILSADHEYAVVATSGHMSSSRHGHARILWREGDADPGLATGIQWCVVHLGAGSSSVAIGKASGPISPRAGTTYGTGTVHLMRAASGHEGGPVETVTVLNASADTMPSGHGIDDGIYCSVAWDSEDVAWVGILECGP